MPWSSSLAHRICVLMAELSECRFESWLWPWCLCPSARHFTIIASLHPGVNGYLWGQSWLLCLIIVVYAAKWQQLSCILPGSWDGFRNDEQGVIDEFQINVDLRTSGFDNKVLSVDACAVWWERESFYCLPRISVVTWHREPRFQCGSARTWSIWNSSIMYNTMI